MADWQLPSHRRQNITTMELYSSSFTIYLLILAIIVSTCLQSVSVSCSKLCQACDQGKCVNETCTCLPGWRGVNCDECYGRISLPAGQEGVIHDGAANYSKDITCSWLLTAPGNNMRVRLVINDFATECIWDHLYVHDGDSAFTPLVSVISGIMWDLKDKREIKFQLSGKYAFIHFYSDAALTLPGFNISYFIDSCNLDCSNNIFCNSTVCECKPGWTGPNCDSLISKCPFNCSNHGYCDEKDGCQCFENYTGNYCSASKGQLLVESMQAMHPSMTGRASFAFTCDDSDELWVLGGFKMGDNNLSNNLFRYSINSKNWTAAIELGPTPWPRYGHTTVFHQGDLYLFGGVNGTVIMKDLWKYNISSKTWSSLTSGPRSISGHTSHVVNGKMLVIFGYSPDYGYSNEVFEYNIETDKWTAVKRVGSIVQGTYGHTSVYDTDRKKIYVYGGYQSSSTYQHTDQLYEFDPISGEWFILQSSGSAQYLHSAAMMNGLMLVFGGNTHNDSQISKQCFASDFMIYDRGCNRWYGVSSSYLDYSIENLDRFGHSAVSVNNTVYIFGGFNSFLKTDLLIIREGNCTFYKSQDVCESVFPGIKCQWQNNQCVTYPDNTCRIKDPEAKCLGCNTCSACQSVKGCFWCGSLCTSSPSTTPNCSQEPINCTENLNAVCGLYQTCNACVEHTECSWQDGNHSKCTAKPNSSSGVNQDSTPRQVCTQKVCSSHHSCENCTSAQCMWCSNLAQCIDTNAYVVSFHYGQCTGWITKNGLCNANNCSTLATCADCQARPKCGWCNDESGTGTGKCFDGGMMGPIRVTAGKPQTDHTDCPSDRWFFNNCPKCQCNGHSTCLNDTNICEKCQFPMTGPQCQLCSDGYYGHPENGAKCESCSCNGQADTCHPVTGECYCRTRGVMGKFCDRCDETNKYSGDPRNGGTCYYQLNTDFQYTFNLSKPDDTHLSRINFLNTPTSSDRDVDFTLNCSSADSSAMINITYKSKSLSQEKAYVTERACDHFHIKFDHKIYAFAGKENTTFFVYVYNFKTPFMIQISFVQPDKINLLRFFIIFFSCFLSLLLIAAALWKIKHKYDGYRRRQQMIVEMQQMASRPFSTIAVEIDRKFDSAVADKRDHLDSVLRRRKKSSNKPSAIAIEPLSDHKAAILTLLIQLPTGDLEYAPSGQSGLAVGSALVSIGTNRKQSLEHIKGDKPKIRKNLTHSHPDACA
ncbi:hypothetical protein BsWGS_01815 [Bradybaena similaris]